MLVLLRRSGRHHVLHSSYNRTPLINRAPPNCAGTVFSADNSRCTRTQTTRLSCHSHCNGRCQHELVCHSSTLCPGIEAADLHKNGSRPHHPSCRMAMAVAVANPNHPVLVRRADTSPAQSRQGASWQSGSGADLGRLRGASRRTWGGAIGSVDCACNCNCTASTESTSIAGQHGAALQCPPAALESASIDVPAADRAICSITCERQRTCSSATRPSLSRKAGRRAPATTTCTVGLPALAGRTSNVMPWPMSPDSLTFALGGIGAAQGARACLPTRQAHEPRAPP